MIVKRLLRKLWFPEISDRETRIYPTFLTTFQWIFKEPRDPDKWDSFISWLEHGEGVYWVTGKAGSGKSTLMRMISDSRIAEGFLGGWASNCLLITASFFFWNSGCKLQMSQEGLLRTLLWKALNARNTLPSGLANKLTVLSFFSTTAAFTEPTWQDLLQMFRLLIEDDSEQVKYFFLLDGLDEFDGDQSRLVDLVQTLGTYPNVKICVSSRPWNVFEDGFRKEPSLMLQHLTYDDIEMYVRENLAQQPAFREYLWAYPQQAADLVKNVTTKASGVFLWVILVVDSLSKGLVDGDRTKDLDRRLKETPEGLEELFKKMLHGLEGRYFTQAARLFRIHRASQNRGIGYDNGLLLLSLDFADEADFEMVDSYRVKPLSGKEWFMRPTSMRRRLNSRCKGLLEIDYPKRGSGRWSIKTLETLISEAESGDLAMVPTLHAYGRALAKTNVQYLHRTVKDYMESPEVWGLIESATKDDEVDPSLSLALANVLLWKSFEEGTSMTSKWETFSSMLQHCLNSIMSLANRDLPKYCQILEIIATAIFDTEGSDSVRRRLGWSPPYQFDDFLSFAVHCNLFEYVQYKLDSLRSDGADMIKICSTLLQGAVRKDISAIHIDDAESDSERKVRSYRHWIGYRRQDGPNVHIVTILLRNGADPTLLINFESSSQIVEKRLCEFRRCGSPIPDLGDSLEGIAYLFGARTTDTRGRPSSHRLTTLQSKAKKIFE